jgi:hypothetical protein
MIINFASERLKLIADRGRCAPTRIDKATAVFEDLEAIEDRLWQEFKAITKSSDLFSVRVFLLGFEDDERKHLSIRQFDERMRLSAFERQKGVCPDCGEPFKIEEMEADHITPWHEGGKTEADNCQMLCIHDNRKKGGK